MVEFQRSRKLLAPNANSMPSPCLPNYSPGDGVQGGFGIICVGIEQIGSFS